MSPLESYNDRIKRERMERDEVFRNPQTSPLPTEALGRFEKLDYYPPDERFKLSGRLTMFPRPVRMTLNTTSGKSVELENVGKLTFTFEGATYELLVFKANALDDFSDGQLFIPFKDQTTGTATHSDGRYLNIAAIPGTADAEIDFNKAFNPLNAYNPKFESVIAPDTNRSNLRATSGQKKYEDLG